jgi:hypothetical protein
MDQLKTLNGMNFMKTISTRILPVIVLVLGLVVSCTDFEPAIPYKNLKHGAYMRTVSIAPPGTYNYFDLSNSTFTITVEYVDAQNGALLDSYDIYGLVKRGTTVIFTERFIKSIPKTAFSPDPESGRPRATFSISYNEAKAVLGFDDSDIEGGDIFEYRAELKLTDGRVYSVHNTGSDIKGGAYFRSPFLYRVNVVCPVVINLAGTWSTIASGDFGDGSGGSSGTYTGLTAVVTIEELSEGVYRINDMSFGLYPQVGYSEPPGRIQDVCGTLLDMGDTDQYGDPFTITGVIVDNNTFTLNWRNTWGDTGTVTATRL